MSERALYILERGAGERPSITINFPTVVCASNWIQSIRRSAAMGGSDWQTKAAVATGYATIMMPHLDPMMTHPLLALAVAGSMPDILSTRESRNAAAIVYAEFQAALVRIKASTNLKFTKGIYDRLTSIHG